MGQFNDDDDRFNNFTYLTSSDKSDYIKRTWNEEDEEDEEYEMSMRTKKERRNYGKCPGGTNQFGRPNYWDSLWGKMLRKPELKIP